MGPGKIARCTKIIWSDEATFKVNDSSNEYNCNSWGHENPYITEEHVYLPEVNSIVQLNTGPLSSNSKFELY